MNFDFQRRGGIGGLASNIALAMAVALALITGGTLGGVLQGQAGDPRLSGGLRHLGLQQQGSSEPPGPLYETRADHDPGGTGKFYMGREIAQVMGPGGIPWLDRIDREREGNPLSFWRQ